jgi:DNA adenine methylase
VLIRYPGSKDQHVDRLAVFMPDGGPLCEPFCGTAAVAFAAIARGSASEVWLNDYDPHIVALWSTVRDSPRELCDLIRGYSPDVDDFYAWREADDYADQLTVAFRKIVLHQVSYSGLGARAGSPIGGRDQSGDYDVGCRWSPTRLVTGVRRCSRLLNRVPTKITNLSWDEVVAQADRYHLYLDPPYIAAGPSLYVHGDIDHPRLAELLKGRDNWTLSYDDVPELRNLYSWAHVERLPVRSHLHHKQIADVVVVPLGEVPYLT